MSIEYVDDPIDAAFGCFAARVNLHEFESFGSLCYLCFGDREDPRHWMPHHLQRLLDEHTFFLCDKQ